MTPQQVAEPAGEPQAVLIATCANCGRQIMRLSLDSARWRHERGAVTCDPPPTVTIEEAPTLANAGRSDPSFDDLVKGDQGT